MVLLNICVCILIFLIGFNLKNAFPSFDGKDKKFLNQLYFVHFGIGIFFHFYVSTIGGDAQFYWSFVKDNSLQEILSNLKPGAATDFMLLLNYIPSKVLQLSFFTGNMMYALLGYLGFIYLYKIIRTFIKERTLLHHRLFGIPVFPYILFLPNLHFWSSGIGKDTILFFCILLFIYSFMKPRTRFIGMIVSVLLSLAIRPHITLFLMVGMGLGFVLDGNLKIYQKSLIFISLLAGFLTIFSYVVNFVQLESLEVTSIQDYADTKADQLNQSDTTSGVDITNYPFPLKVFTFLYRPFFFDIQSFLAILASFENLILLLFTITIFRSGIWRCLKQMGGLMKGMVFYFLIGTFAFSLILGNLGIMLRQKNQFIPVFIIFGFWVLYHYQFKKIKIGE